MFDLRHISDLSRMLYFLSVDAKLLIWAFFIAMHQLIYLLPAYHHLMTGIKGVARETTKSMKGIIYGHRYGLRYVISVS